MRVQEAYGDVLQGRQYVMQGGIANFTRRLSSPDGINYIDGWTIQGITFPDGFSFAGWTMTEVKFIECDLRGCDFTGAKTEGMKLDLCTIGDGDLKGLDMDTLAENRMPNPYEAIAAMASDVMPRRRRDKPRQP